MSLINLLGIDDYGNVAKGILFSVYEVFWKIVHAIGSLIDVITGLFYKLAGVDYLGSGSETLVEEQDLLSRLFNQNVVSGVFLFMIFVSVALMGVFGAVAVIKQNYLSREEARSMGGVFKNMLFAILFLFCLAPLSLVAISTVSTITSAIVGMFGDTTNISLADLLFDVSFSGNPIEAYNSLNSTEITNWTEMENGFLFDLEYGSVDTGVTFYWYVYLLCAGLVLYNLIIIVLKLLKRIFNVIIMYLLAPIYVARMVDDGGVKFKEWKNKIFAELLSIVGTTVAFLTLMSLMGVISNLELIQVSNEAAGGLIDQETEVSGTIILINNLTKAFLIVAGVSVAKDAGDLFGNLFNSNNDEATSLLEGVFNRLGPKEYSTVNNSESSAPRTRVITRNTTSTRRVINYNEAVPTSTSRLNNDRPTNVNNTRNSFTTNINNVDNRINNVQSKSNVSISQRAGSSTGNYRIVGNQNDGSKIKPSDIINQSFMNGIAQENNKLRNEWEFLKNGNNASSQQVVKEFESASKDFDSSIRSGEPEKIKASMDKYVVAYKNEEKVAKEGYRDFAGKSAKLSNDLTAKQQQELRNISNAYRKAQVDYGKTARRLSEVSQGNMSAADALRVKEKADKQREKLMSASSKANEFYNNQKKGV